MSVDFPQIESRLARARAGLEAALAAVPETDWKRSPALGGWSVGEVVAHLIQIEGVVQAAGARALTKPPCSIPRRVMPRKLWPPIWLIPYRGLKRESPVPLDPALVTTKAEMLARLTERRAATLTFLRRAMDEHGDLTGFQWKHPFFGALTFYEWCRVLGYHEVRHTKQIREIVSSFQR